MLRFFREKSGHHQTTPGWLPTRAPGRGMDGKRRSESDLACKERRQGLSREPNLTRSGQRTQQPPGLQEGTRPPLSQPGSARRHRRPGLPQLTPRGAWLPAVIHADLGGTLIPHFGPSAEREGASRRRRQGEEVGKEKRKLLQPGPLHYKKVRAEVTYSRRLAEVTREEGAERSEWARPSR